MNRFNHSMTTPVSAMSDDELETSIDYCQRWRPLFDGLPRGISLLDAALCKFARRDPLAIEFMRNHTVTA